MGKIEHEFEVSFPCGLQVRSEASGRSWLGDVRLPTPGIDLSRCPMHGEECSSEANDGET